MGMLRTSRGATIIMLYVGLLIYVVEYLTNELDFSFIVTWVSKVFENVL